MEQKSAGHSLHYWRNISSARDYEELRDTRDHFVAFRSYSFLLDDCVNVTVLNPVIPHEYNNRNENSIVLKMVVGEVVFLFTGDAGEYAEGNMLNDGIEMNASVLKVGHHGSEYSTSSSFLNAVDPDVAVISVGEVNSHGHPNDITVNRLGDVGATTFMTSMYGDLIITTDGTGFVITAKKNPGLTSVIATGVLTAGALILWKYRPHQIRRVVPRARKK